MKVRIKTNDWEALFYESTGACGFDFKCVEDLVFAPGEFKLVETWTVVEVPEWYVLLTAPRSSTFKKHWLIQVNSTWIIDQDYCGENDTIKFPYLNMSWIEQKIEAWTRIWQWMFVAIAKPEFEVVQEMWNTDRWGFWSTWVK